MTDCLEFVNAKSGWDWANPWQVRPWTDPGWHWEGILVPVRFTQASRQLGIAVVVRGRGIWFVRQENGIIPRVVVSLRAVVDKPGAAWYSPWWEAPG